MAFQDFDLISQRREQQRREKLRRRITTAVVSSVVVLLVVGAAMGAAVIKSNNESDVSLSENNKSHHPSSPSSSSHSPSSSSSPSPNVAEAVAKRVCSVVDYKKTCEGSLLKQVKGKDEAKPEAIVKASLSVALKEVGGAMNRSREIEFDTPFKKAAFNDCLVLLNDAVEELNASISSIEGGGLSSATPEIKNWLSAVLSYQQTCIDGFPDGAEKDKMQKLLNTSKELGSNALAVVTQASAIFKALRGSKSSERRLLASDDGFVVPDWVDPESRRVLKSKESKFTPNATVAKDGTGNFTTIAAALDAIPEKFKGRYVIYIKEGIYDESVVVSKKMQNITMYGDGSQKSIITGNKNYVDGVPTYQTATFAVVGDGFLGQSLGFRNTAGPEKHQAVALRVQSDRSIFVNCRMEGYQDTLYAQTHRQFYRSCYIRGTVDFIFGDAAAVFQNCMIYVTKPLENQKNVVTAQGRIDKRQTTGIVLQNCKILADDQLEPVKARFQTYLGRPWKEYSRTIVMESEIGDLISPAGWLEWSGDFALKTLFYGEYNNKGPGSGTSDRVKWAGYKTLQRNDALRFTAGPFLQGETWLDAAVVPVRFGMFT
ncbi:hypothetical protein M569_08543 [Genlisea aurea]|uniref:Pectinesterase n=1 Tax=Genlisea aurea TaxID=192259 RepID=S8CGX1_9LAMI|nr:hypothetical protein M569_08543 [Genlisea aurea]